MFQSYFMNYFNITWIKILTGIEKWLEGHKWKDTDKWQVGLISPTIVFVKGPDTQIRNRLSRVSNGADTQKEQIFGYPFLGKRWG